MCCTSRVFVSALILTHLLLPATLRAQEDPPSTKEIKVTARCPADLETGAVEIIVEPWVSSVERGREMVWDLRIEGSTDDSIAIEAKKGKRWLFKTRELRGRGRARGREWKKGASGEYNYNITLYCGTEKIIVDPRIRVRGG